MKKTLKSIGIAVIYIYLTGALLIATPYFNWKFARQHGVSSWFAFGEIVATAKAAIWPYYAVASLFREHGSIDSRNDLHYTNSKRACDKAMQMVVEFGGVMALPPKEASEVVQLLQAAVIEAKLVNDDYLESVHPEFRQRYRDDYVDSLRYLAEGVLDGDRVKQINAAATYNRFSEWMRVHAKALKFP